MLAAALLATAGPAAAAEFSDPDWPCIQRKVPHISPGQMWAGPQIDEAKLGHWRQDAEVAALAPALAIRRTAMDQAEALIADFAADAGSGAARGQRLALLFAAAFALIEAERTTIVAGIARYARKQAALAERIEGMRDELEALKAATPPNYDRIEELEDTIAWDTRIFHDRAQSLSYVCETPVILEKRAFALAQAIMAHLE